MFAPPTALLLGIVGVIRDAAKGFAIAALVISGLTLSVWLLPLFA